MHNIENITHSKTTNKKIRTTHAFTLQSFSLKSILICLSFSLQQKQTLKIKPEVEIKYFDGFHLFYWPDRTNVHFFNDFAFSTCSSSSCGHSASFEFDYNWLNLQSCYSYKCKNSFTYSQIVMPFCELGNWFFLQQPYQFFHL